MEILADGIARKILETYKEKTPRSMAHQESAGRYLPGGDTRSATYFSPYPLYMEKGRGCRLWDADGNEYLDLLGNYTSLIHGHAPPAIVDAIREQALHGTVFGAAGAIQYRHAEHLCRRIPSMEKIRYCNSGTEATLFVIRAARAHTGRDGIIKIDGGYHGGHDLAEVNNFPDVETDGPPKAFVHAGIPASVLQDAWVVPFNDLTAVAAILNADADRIVAIIVEPVLGAGGVIPPQPGYLAGLREMADRFKVLLIFDEVITLRLSSGGMQELSGVMPDLTSLGKIIGGGLPAGAFGGKADVMAIFDPTHPRAITHSGTFNAANLVMTAGLCAMKALDQPAIDHINRLGERLKSGIENAFKAAGVRGQVSGIGSLNQIHWCDRPLHNARDAARAMADAGDLPGLLHLEMINRGIYSAKRGMFIISTPMSEVEIDKAVAAFCGAMEMLQTYIAANHPQLVVDG
ncbi:Glutamate-1-semialdehyde 2,1-aminomutase (EC [Olavius algarvensis Delta 1 endosymbiont]|nr:Glutamate-1-semialdehyde 2,1-aminomutase (EC [Olavius algarvensis Delta 1 endosymbiont]